MRIEFISSGGGGGEGTTISLTTNNTSGASTLSGTGALNIPIYSDTNINIGNTDLVSSGASRTFKVAGGGNLKLQTNAGLNTLEVNDSNIVVIGNTNSYTLPNTRGNQNDVLGLTNGTGTAKWRTQVHNNRSFAQCNAGAGRTIELEAIKGVIYSVDTTGKFYALTDETSTVINTKIIPISLGVCFRQRSQGANGLMGVADFIDLKLCFSDTSTSWDIYVIACDMGNSAITSVPIVQHKIGSLLLGGKDANTWKCLSLNLSSAVPIMQNKVCQSYFLGISPNANIPSVDINQIAQYNNDDVVLTSYI